MRAAWYPAANVLFSAQIVNLVHPGAGMLGG